MRGGHDCGGGPCPSIFGGLRDTDALKGPWSGVGSLAELPLVELLAEQIECASRVVLTHSEAMGRQEYDVVCEMITALNPSAIISRSNAFTAADLAQSGGFGVKDWWSQTRWSPSLTRR